MRLLWGSTRHVARCLVRVVQAWAFVWVALSAHAAHADVQARSFVLTDEALTGKALGRYVDVLEDPTGELSLADVQHAPNAQRFERSLSSTLGFGLTKSAYWVRFQVENPQPQARVWLFEIGYPQLDDIALFVPRADSSFELRHTGDHLPFASREVLHRNYLFQLTQPQGVSQFYLRVRTTGSLALPLHAWSPMHFIEFLNLEHPPLWIFYGVMLVMALYNLFVFASVRDVAYLYYVCYIVSYIGLQFSLNGFAFEYLWPNQSWWNSRSLLLWLYFGFAFGALFQRQFLRLWEEFPLLDRLTLGIGVAGLVLSASTFVLPYSSAIRMLVVLGVLEVCLIMFTTVRTAWTRSRSALYYAASWVVLLSGVMLFLLRTLGVLGDSFLSVWGSQLGAAIEVTLLSLGLADRINVMRRSLQRLNSQLSQNVEQLEQALQQAEAATRAKSEFVASVSHELRTPLNAIVNIPPGLLEDFQTVPALQCSACGTEFALEPNEPADTAQPCPQCHAQHTLHARTSIVYTGQPAEAHNHLQRIHKASKHLLAVVSSILDFSQLEAQRMRIELKDVDLMELIGETLQPLYALAEAKHVPLRLLPNAGDTTVRADAVRIAQVVVNVVGNAIKFSNGSGEITVAVTDEPDACVIRVTDQGIGIAAADLDKLFQSFSQVDSSHTRRFGGTGLGLAISKHLVDLHGGQIWADSEPGRGSSFSVRLPRRPRVSNDNDHIELPVALPARGLARAVEDA